MNESYHQHTLRGWFRLGRGTYFPGTSNQTLRESKEASDELPTAGESPLFSYELFKPTLRVLLAQQRKRILKIYKIRLRAPKAIPTYKLVLGTQLNVI